MEGIFFRWHSRSRPRRRQRHHFSLAFLYSHYLLRGPTRSRLRKKYLPFWNGLRVLKQLPISGAVVFFCTTFAEERNIHAYIKPPSYLDCHYFLAPATAYIHHPTACLCPASCVVPVSLHRPKTWWKRRVLPDGSRVCCMFNVGTYSEREKREKSRGSRLHIPLNAPPHTRPAVTFPSFPSFLLLFTREKWYSPLTSPAPSLMGKRPSRVG